MGQPSESRGRQGLPAVTPVVTGLAGLQPGPPSPNILPHQQQHHDMVVRSLKASIIPRSLGTSPRLAASRASSP